METASSGTSQSEQLTKDSDLRSCLRDLVAITSLHAIWVGWEPQKIAESLSEVLQRALGAQFVFVRLNGKPDVDVARTADPALGKKELATLLSPLLSRTKPLITTLSHVEEEKLLSVCVTPIGPNAQWGLIAVGSSRIDFNAETTTLLLNVSANHAATALKDVQLLTAQKQAAEALAASEAKFRRLVSLMPVAVYTCDTEGRITYYNERAAELWGQRPALGDGKHRFNGAYRLWKLDGSLLPHDQTPMAEAVRSGASVQNREIIIERPDGTRITVNVNIDPLYDVSGNLSGAINVFQDVTELRQAEETVRQSEQRLRAIIDTTPECVKIVDSQGILLHMNSVGLGLVEADCAEAVLGKSIYEVIAPEDRDRYRDFNERICQGEKGSLEFDIIGLHGTRRQMETHATPLNQSDGSRVQLAITRDVTARKRAERAMGILAAVVDSSDDAIVSKNLDGIITSWNEGAEQLFGYSAKEAIGEHITFIIPPDRQNEEIEILERIRRGERVPPFETVRKRKDGTLVDISVTISPIRNREGHVIGASKVARDISERKRMEREREQLLDREKALRVQAEASARVKDEFVATVSHELRNPLNAVLGWSSMLSRGNLDKSQFQQAIEIIQRNATAQAKLIEDLLDVGRIISGKLRLNVVPTSLTRIVYVSTDAVRPAAEAKRISLLLEMNASADNVNADEGRLQQVIWNLLSNAVKFTPEGGTVHLKTALINGEIEITVTDSGKGIQPDFLPFVFERFRQADSSLNRKHGGLGLGLAIARHLVEMHGGTIQAYSQGEGKGASFTIRLPVRSGQEENTTPTVPTRSSEFVGDSSSSARSVTLEGVKVLAIDDAEDSREMIRVLLNSHGAEVRTAGSAFEGLQMLVTWEPAVIVCDLGMPGEDGYSFIQRARKLTDKSRGIVPAIAFSGYVRLVDQVRAHDAGFQKFVQKPINPEELISAIASLARQSEEAREAPTEHLPII